MSEVVLDASAILAFLQGEPGADLVAENLPQAKVSAVNLSEVLSKLADRGVDRVRRGEILQSLPFEVVGFGLRQAENAADLRRISRQFGLSFADRACLALGAELQIPILTADRVWCAMELDIEIELIR